MSIGENLSGIRSSLPDGVKLCAVSKFHGADKLQEAYNAGQRLFGESRVQELCGKAAQLPSDIEWHFIGHLQTNKVRQLVPVASMIESVDSIRLLTEIERCCAQIGKTMPVLLEVHVAKEESKTGFAPDELRAYLSSGQWRTQMPHIRISGLMAMATNTDDEATVSRDFATAEQLFSEFKAAFFPSDDAFSLRSWGMSGDYKVALRHSANIVRIGTAIFGPREI